jgi:hypothetical protein
MYAGPDSRLPSANLFNVDTNFAKQFFYLFRRNFRENPSETFHEKKND